MTSLDESTNKRDAVEIVGRENKCPKRHKPEPEQESKSLPLEGGCKPWKERKTRTRPASKGNRGCLTEVEWIEDEARRRELPPVVAKVEGTRQPSLASEEKANGVFVTDEVVLPNHAGPIARVSFALGQQAPTKEQIDMGRPATAHDKGIEFEDIRDALKATRSPVTIVRRKEIRFFNELVGQHVGMFIFLGDIHHTDRNGKEGVAPHYGSYDAGRKVLYDRPLELTVLEPTDLSKEGATTLFYKKYAKEDAPNLGWAVIRQVWQVIHAGPSESMTGECGPAKEHPHAGMDRRFVFLKTQKSNFKLQTSNFKPPHSNPTGHAAPHDLCGMDMAIRFERRSRPSRPGLRAARATPNLAHDGRTPAAKDPDATWWTSSAGRAASASSSRSRRAAPKRRR